MNIDKVKEIISNRTFKIILSALLIILLIFYLKYFFTYGVYYNNTFLEKKVNSSDIQYIGKSNEGEVKITVKGLINDKNSIDVKYSLPNDINEQYTVNFGNKNNAGYMDIYIKNEDGFTIFEGKYRYNGLFMLDKDGKPYTRHPVIRFSDAPVYSTNYKVSLINVVDFATGAKDTIRGKYEYFIFAMILFLITFIDIKFPLFFFTLRNFLDVKDPEPSDFYITIQRVSWIAYPIIGIFLMLAAISSRY